MRASLLRFAPFLAIAGLAGVGAALMSTGGSEAAAHEASVTFVASELEPVALPSSNEVFLLRSGMTPEVLAAIGTTAPQFSAFMMHTGSACTTAIPTLAASDAALAESRRERDRLQREIRTGLARSEDVVALAQAKTNFEARSAARDGVLQEFRVGACDELPVSGATALANIIANRNHKLPIEFLVVQRSEADWITLRDSLVEEKAAARFGVDPNPDLANFLTTARAEQAVATAKANLDSNLTAIQAAWDATFTD